MDCFNFGVDLKCFICTLALYCLVDGLIQLRIVPLFSDAFVQLPDVYRKTMTYDNGVKMEGHKYIAQNTGIKVFFAHPYSSRERCTNKNTYGLIRRFYPKKTTDFYQINNEELKALQDKLNNRP